MKFHRSRSAKNAIKCALKIEQLLEKQDTELDVEKATRHEIQKRKKTAVKKRYHDQKIHKTIYKTGKSSP